MNITFGKYYGKSYDHIYQLNQGYIEWLLKQVWFKKKTEDYQYCLQLISQPIPVDTDTMVIYTDGACSNNGRQNAKCGIGIHYSKKNPVYKEDISRQLSVPNPTNNVAELTAILVAIQSVEECQKNIMILTDSDYCIRCITRWYPEWVAKNALDKKNIKLIEQCYYLSQKLPVTFTHIKAHTGLQDEHSIGNQVADRLATRSLS